MTQAGKEILQKAKLVKNEIKGINELAEIFSKISRPISLGIIPTISPYFLPLILPKIEKELPSVLLKIEESQSNILV